MKLLIFNADTAARQRSSYRSIGINRRNARLSFSASLAAEWGITEKSRVLYARDTDEKCAWYVRLDTTGNERALSVKTYTNGGSKTKTYGVCARRLAFAVLDSLKAQRGASLLVAKTPTKINGEEWYQLLTANPLRKN